MDEQLIKNKDKIFWISRTALFISMVIAWQGFSAVFGNQLITGSGVNLILAVTAVASGLSSGLVVAMVSPIMAKFFGIGPLWQIIPFMAAGNAALVLLWHYIGGLKLKNKYAAYIAALVPAAVGKFLVLYFGIVKFAIPFLLDLSEPQAKAVSYTFSFPQLITASVGGVLAIAVLPVITKAVKIRNGGD